MDRPYDIYSAPETADQAFAQTQSTAETPHPLASRWLRLVAAIIDVIVVAAPAILVTYLLGGYADMADDGTMTPRGVAIGLVAGLALFILIQGPLIYRSAQTLGKRMFHMQVVNAKTWQPISGNRYLFIRYLPITLIANLPFIGPIVGLVNSLLIFRKGKNCLHDDIAGTRVIDLRSAAIIAEADPAEETIAADPDDENPYAQR